MVGALRATAARRARTVAVAGPRVGRLQELPPTLPLRLNAPPTNWLTLSI